MGDIRMKKTIALVTLVVFATISMMGCSSSSFESGEATIESTTTTETVINDAAKQNLKEPFPIEVLGTIYQLYDTDNPAINNTTLELSGSKYRGDFYGNINGRWIYENDENLHIEIMCPDNSLSISIAIVPHNESSDAYYEDFQSKYSTDDFFIQADTYRFHLISLSTWKYPPVYYDFVILANDKPIAVVMIKIFEQGGIENSGKKPLDLQNSEIKLTRNSTTN